MTTLNLILLGLCLIILLKIWSCLRSILSTLNHQKSTLSHLSEKYGELQSDTEFRFDRVMEQVEGMRSDYRDMQEAIDIIQDGLDLNITELKRKREKAISHAQKLMEADDDGVENLLDEFLDETEK